VARSRWLWVAGPRPSALVAVELWDAESWHFLATRQAQVARKTGALVQLRLALNFGAGSHILAGELTTAALMLDEDHLIAEATGNPPISYTDMLLAAWRGEETQAAELIEATVRQATERALGRFVDLATYASSVLYNASVAMTPRATPPRERSRAIRWRATTSSCQSWPKRRPGRAT
jgi:hypothetical protein